MSHLGRPKGEVIRSKSLVPVARRLSELLGASVSMAPDCVGDKVEEMVKSLKPGEVLLLENLRFHVEEEQNNPGFAQRLAGIADVFINDAFATAHRAHASNVGICDYIDKTAAGFLMLREVEFISKALESPKRPMAAIVGGAKISGKLEVIENMVERVDKLLIGGGMAFTFVRALGQETGKSLVEEGLVQKAVEIMEKAKETHTRFYLPVDCICALGPKEDTNLCTKTIQEIPEGLMGLDIGPATLNLFSEALDECSTIVWNGPMGVFESDAFAKGTLGVAECVAASKALTIVGGGDTDAALHRSGLIDQVDFVSTAGGAFLEMLGGKVLPGVRALEAQEGL
jgi:phosphoglycerate kinase